MESPEYFIEKHKEIVQRYSIIIPEIVKSYPKYKSTPEFNAYEEKYERNISNLHNLQEEIFSIQTKIDKNNNHLQKDITTIDNILYDLEKKNKVLQKKLDSIVNSDDAAGGRLTDSKLLYNQKLTENLIFGIVISYLMYKYFKHS